MENNKIERIKKSAGVTAKVLNVIRTILIVGMVLAIVGGITTMAFRVGDEGKSVEVFGKKIVVHNMVSFGDLEVESFSFLKPFDIQDPFVLAGANCFCAAVLIALAIVVVYMLEKTFVVIKDSDTPFRAEILKRVRIAGIIVTVITLSSSVGTAVIVGLAFWCLYCILDYGIELQKDADETL